MLRKTDNHKFTASISNAGLVTVMYDEGWEDLVDYRQQFASEIEARAHLLATDWEEFDPNAALKAAGLKWNGYCYA